MEFVFTEGDYEDSFRFGGQLEIVANGAQEVESLVKHFKLFSDSSDTQVLRQRIAALESGKLSHVIKSDKRPVYGVESCLDHEFTVPYKKWALDNLGYDGVFPDLIIPRKWDGLLYTNYQAELYTSGEHICFNAYVNAEPWNGKDAQDYAKSRVVDSISEEFGSRYQEPEFIMKNNGQYYKNPSYLKRHKPTPSASNTRLKRAFFDWWLQNVANAEQKEIVAGNAKVSKGADYMNAFKFEYAERTIYYEHTGSDYKSISFSDFAKLGS